MQTPEWAGYYTDTCTGYEGYATARIEHLGGDVQLCLERVGNEGSVQEAWFREGRLTRAEEGGKGNGKTGFARG